MRRLARAVRRSAVRIWLSTGDRVECPCCGRSFRSFLAQGAFNRPNVECPVCGSHERHRMLWLYLTDAHPELLEERPLRFLHFAPEESFTRLLRSRPNVEYVSADLDSPLAEQKADIQALPFPDESFDALLCSHVLEHVEDDRRAMGELHRVLRPGGWGIVMVPQHGGLAETLEDPSVDTPQARLETYGQADHLRLYGRDFQDRLRAAGFDVEVTQYAQELPSELRTRYVLGPDRIHLCRRA